MDRSTVADIFGWDIKNWSKALPFWEERVPKDLSGMNCLELGGRKGGPTLWLALKGANVLCSDIDDPTEIASELHNKYELKGKIEYKALDATKINDRETFDIIIFKSILGGICRNGQDALKKEMIDSLYRALKPGGKLIFAENLEASGVHKFFRKKFVKWGAQWNYLKYEEVEHVFSSFSNLEYDTTGFWGLFGRSEGQRNFLASFDNVFRFMTPKSKRYIVYGVATK